jgi:Fe-S cluster assembly iron-binding protein IscA
MKIKANKDVLDYIKQTLPKRGRNAVRLELSAVCCGLSEIDVKFDDKKEDDTTYELDGVTFVASNEFGFLLNDVELERTPMGIDVKRESREF